MSSQRKYILGVFIDISKAVNHNSLPNKLKAYGIQSKNLWWFEANCQIKNSLICTTISKQKWKMLIVEFLKVFYIRAFVFSGFGKQPEQFD